MGITGLTKVLKEQLTSDDAIHEVKLDKYTNRRLCIDINIYLHNFAYNASEKKSNSHIDGFFQMIVDLLKHKITPIMIMDGKPPKAKDDTIANRSALKQELRAKVDTLEKEIDVLVNQLNATADKIDDTDDTINKS